MQFPFFKSLRFKIGIGYIVLVALNVGVMTWAIFNFGRLTQALDSVLVDNYPNVIAVENMVRAIEKHQHALSTILNKDIKNGKIELTMAEEEFSKWFQTANKNPTVQIAKQILDNVRSTYDGYLLHTDSLMALVYRQKYVEAKAFHYNTMNPFYQRLTDNCFWLIEEYQKQMSEVGERTKQISKETNIAVLSVIFAIGLSLLTMYQFTKRIIKPTEQLTETVQRIGRGRLDLKIDVETNDEIGTLGREFNKMTERLRKFEEMNLEHILLEKRKSETIVSNISDAIIVCDADGSVRLMNRSAEELLQVQEKDVVGRHFETMKLDERLLHILKEPTDSSYVSQPYLQFQLNGRSVYLRPRVSTIQLPQHDHKGIVLVLQDVTQFKELDKMKSDFMATVTHEFRTPVTSINMGVDILRQHLLGPLTNSQEELLISFKQDCERLTKLVRELLQLSKLESGMAVRHEEIVNLNKVVNSTVGPLQVQFNDKGVLLKITLDETLPLLRGDEQQFSWVISNLVSNALRYTDTGGRVEIVGTSSGEGILVQVKDTGKGIPVEQQGKIFNKFVQVKQAFDTTPGSVGLGLAIAKEIVEMYGGKIWVESAMNKGSIFSFRLPIEPVYDNSGVSKQSSDKMI